MSAGFSLSPAAKQSVHNSEAEKLAIDCTEVTEPPASKKSKSCETCNIWRNQRTRKLRFVNFWISFRGTFHRECMAFLLT